MLFFYILLKLSLHLNCILGQTSNTTEEYEYIDDRKPVYIKPVFNVKIEMPTTGADDYEYYDIENSSQTSATTSTFLLNCGRICESTEFDSITSLTSNENFTQEFVILFRDHCFWIIDINKGLNQSQLGTNHQFIFDKIEASFSIQKSDHEFNVTAIFTSGLSSQSLLFDGLSSTQLLRTTHPFPGLLLETNKQIDDTFIWLETKTVYFIQNNRYLAYDLTNKTQFFGYPRNLSDFGLSSDPYIHSATVIQNKIYFFSKSHFAIYSVEKRNKESALFSGHLSGFMPIDKLFLKCPKIEILLRNLNTNESTERTSSQNLFEVDGDSNEGKEFPIALILLLTFLFIFLIIASIVLIFVLIRNNSIKKRIAKNDKSVREPPKVLNEKSDKINADLKQKSKELEDKDLVNRITIYSSGKSVTSNAVINVKI